MTSHEFRALLDLLMCSDPWPVNDGEHSSDILYAFADKEARQRNFLSWLDAYHRFRTEPESRAEMEGRG